eukprot:g38268.t1
MYPRLLMRRKEILEALASAVVPEDWKISNIAPLLENGGRHKCMIKKFVDMKISKMAYRDDSYKMQEDMNGLVKWAEKQEMEFSPE